MIVVFMKKWVSVIIILIMLSIVVSAAVPYTVSLEIVNLRIKEVQCSDYKLNVLVESSTDMNVNVLLKIATDKGSIDELTNQKIMSYEASYIYIDTDFKCSEIKYIDAKAYLIVDQDMIIFNNLESFYTMAGTEKEVQVAAGIIQETSNEIIAGNNVYPDQTSNMYLRNRLLVSIKIPSNEVHYYSQDTIGSNSIVTDELGNIVEKQEFEPFGNKINYGTEKYGFTGKELDSSGLNYYGARYYDSGIGKFTGLDPISDYSQSPYNYVDNNPINYIDPDGKQALKPMIPFMDPKYPGINKELMGYAKNIKRIPQDIKTRFNVNFDAANINFGGNPNFPQGAMAAYDFNTKLIESPYLPVITNKYGMPMNFDVSTFERNLYHEYTHDYMDDLFKSKGMDLYSLVFKNNKITSNNMLIVEGIAEYVANTFTNGRDNFKDSDYPRNLNKDPQAYLRSTTEMRRIYYYGGYHLVKPIIDKFGLEKSSLYMMKNPPTDKELNNLPAYRTRMMKGLSGK